MLITREEGEGGGVGGSMAMKLRRSTLPSWVVVDTAVGWLFF